MYTEKAEKGERRILSLSEYIQEAPGMLSKNFPRHSK
jgi:hypothetical protein